MGVLPPSTDWGSRRLLGVLLASDTYTAAHSARVRSLTLFIGRELGVTGDELETLAEAALFHDVGKIDVDEHLLVKPGTLTDAERDEMREHAEKGAEMVSRLSPSAAAVTAILHHHERWDGTGYPDGLAGEEIPLSAAIIALADAWDAMTTERPYRPSLSFERALDEVGAERGKQFHPQVVDAFLALAARAPEALEAQPAASPARAAG